MAEETQFDTFSQEELSNDTFNETFDSEELVNVSSQELDETTQESWQAGVGDTVRGAGSTIAAGFTALRDVRRASKDAEYANRDVERMQEELEIDRDELAHRVEIERDYAQIVERQTIAYQAAEADASEAQNRVQQALAQQNALKTQLEAMRATHEETLSPYRNLMESTKSRADDTARSLAEARRNVKSAQTQANNAEKQRNQRINQAIKAHESAQDRLRRTEAELARLNSSGEAPQATLAKLQNEVIAEHAHVDLARSEINSVTEAEQNNIDNLKQRLLQQRQALEAAEREASAAKEEATQRKEEYDDLYRKAMAEEDALTERINEFERTIAQEQNEIQAADTRKSEAKELLDEAHEIHATPELTAALQQRITAAGAELSARTAEAHKLESQARELRAITRGQRIAFVAAAAAVIALLVLIVWIVLTR